MKTVPATRKIKEEIYRHFLGGNNAAQLTDEHKRVHISTIQECQIRAFETKTKTKRAPAPIAVPVVEEKKPVPPTPVQTSAQILAHCRLYGCRGPGRDCCPVTENVHCPS